MPHKPALHLHPAFYLVLAALISLAIACSRASLIQTAPGSPAAGQPAPAPTSLVSPAASALPSPLPSTPDAKTYTNPPLGLSFSYPSAWYGPDVYEWEAGVRIAIGSDVVYPYGTGLEEQNYTIPNSYYITIQYQKNTTSLTLEQFSQGQPWAGLLDAADGASLSGPRYLVTRVRGLRIGAFSGLETISTLPETAQTEFFYTRQAILYDPQMNTLTITGSPNNVQAASAAALRDAYRSIDETNRLLFYKILESIVIGN